MLCPCWLEYSNLYRASLGRFTEIYRDSAQKNLSALTLFKTLLFRMMQPHRISVRSVTHSRRTSRDAACTMVIGKDIALGPTAVKASNVTATSAVISWLPSNSNHQHVVCVNNVEVRTVKPGVYRHTITGLAPSTIYRVTVKAKNLRATHFEDQNAQAANNLACHVHFKTLPKGLPDPPVDIQVN